MEALDALDRRSVCTADRCIRSTLFGLCLMAPKDQTVIHPFGLMERQRWQLR